ncbi:hypothetical protein Poli38472_014539 [Pythium oligandrum]|uniref:Myb-like DNA-binding protein n=1 Tax=Pythium oligandrum TaxID=41045 RepID=A0A8K1FJU4_PYTOL|nr:hypothetical protein Poli38472_014539 [Pythium oligandrum]|eukprot:TMW61078.1 hypothetical protein Poli38472_014539 [Pythium oligandrum]
MTISANVRKELFEMTSAEGKLIRIKPTEAKAGTTVYSSKQSQPLKMWTQEEHEKFLEAMEKYPSGPWKVIAAFIGTKTTRQTMTHAQKYRQKISRWRRGLRHKGRKHSPDGSSGHGSASGSDTEYSAKENLFKAIEYVSGDDMSQYEGHGASQPEMDAGSQLFRLAELASIEVMKNSPPGMNPADYAMAQENNGMIANQMMQHKQDWYNGRPSKEWSTQRTEIKLSPLRQSEKQLSGEYQPLTTCSMQINQLQAGLLVASDFSEDELQNSNAFRLPPLKMPAHGGNLAAIPPLRSKIDPTVFNLTQYASTN